MAGRQKPMSGLSERPGPIAQPYVLKAGQSTQRVGVKKGVAMQSFFSITLFTSALLLFIVQPMFGKMVLPLLGGTPAVWNTCMVFYQASLLAGYVYAHLSTHWLGVRRQAALHLAVLCLPWLVLPISMTGMSAPPAEGDPIPWLLMLLAVSVGLPFFVVSSTAPMLQAWFANTGHPAGRDPYFLYAASNLGSMIALLAYPVLIEPSLPLAGQSTAWALGYGLLTALTLGCAVLLWRSPARTPAASTESEYSTEGEHAGWGERSMGAAVSRGPTLWLRMRWVALSLVPSSLLLGVTAHISTDIAAVPLLWVVPLALYLLTFVLVFARRQLLPQAWMIRLQPFLVLLIVLFLHSMSKTVWLMLLLHLATFFVTAMVCHGELARTRPSPKHLTEFYLWMSIGGVLGGMFNALVAPQLFSGHVEYLCGIIEYPLAIAVACLLRPRIGPAGDTARAARLDLGLPLAVLVALGGLAVGLDLLSVPITHGVAIAIIATAGLIVFSFQNRPVRYGLGTGAVLIIGSLCFRQGASLLEIERNFYGVIRVSYNPELPGVSMFHGSTNHGMQCLDAERRDEPLTYYHRGGPLGEIFDAISNPRTIREIGVTGLGTGSVASYGQPNQRITFFEIDPAVVRIAQNPEYFTFLNDCQAQVDIVLGDARLTLANVPDAHFDLLILDAFSSDAIPVHLITREAIQLYLDKLAARGILALHLSNRYLDLEPVLGRIAQNLGVACRVRKDGQLSARQRKEGKLTSTWAVIARRPEDLGKLRHDPQWQPAAAHSVGSSYDRTAPLWTDDFSNIVTILRWW